MAYLMKIIMDVVVSRQIVWLKRIQVEDVFLVWETCSEKAICFENIDLSYSLDTYNSNNTASSETMHVNGDFNSRAVL